MIPTPTAPGQQPLNPGDFPSIAEQKQFWSDKERIAAMQEPEKLMKAVEAFGVFLDEMNHAISKLRREFNQLT